MAFHEWTYIKEHPAVWRILLGILVIPLVYAATFLASVWNPYGQLKQLPMAVVNQDRPTSVHWGRTVTHELLRNKSLDFRQLNAHQAQHDLWTGKVYLVLTLPSTTSRQLARLATHPQTIQVTYQTNAGRSAVAAKMGNTAMQKLQAKLNHAVVQSELTTAQHQAQRAQQRLELATQQLEQTTRASVAGVPAATTAAMNEAIIQGIVRGNQATQSRTPRQLRALAAPIQLKQHDVAPIANNGTGMAPYFMVISLFVGCITLNIIYDAGKRRGNYRNFLMAWLDKMSMLWGFVLLAASCMWLAVWYINGLRPLAPGKTYLLCLLIVLAFFSLVTCFRLWLGLTGAWLMLIFMIFQIGVSGGTYPIELTNSFYQLFHPYLPMTIAMTGLRHTISLGGSITGVCEILAGMVLVFSLGTLGYFYWHRHDQVIA